MELVSGIAANARCKQQGIALKPGDLLGGVSGEWSALDPACNQKNTHSKPAPGALMLMCDITKGRMYIC